MSHYGNYMAKDNFCCSLAIIVARASGCQSFLNEPPHDKTNKVSVRPAKTQISLGIRPV